jgi:hypothetical protein
MMILRFLYSKIKLNYADGAILNPIITISKELLNEMTTKSDKK